MMTDSITLSLPDDIASSVRKMAQQSNQTVEEVILSHLKNLPLFLPPLPIDIQDELSAFAKLSDDTLWTIAREQLPSDVQNRAHVLMTKNNQGGLSDNEERELDRLVQRADRLMLRKAEAATILRSRGNQFTQHDFNPQDD